MSFITYLLAGTLRVFSDALSFVSREVVGPILPDDVTATKGFFDQGLSQGQLNAHVKAWRLFLEFRSLDMLTRGTYHEHLTDVSEVMGRVNIIVRFCQWLYDEVGLRGTEITAAINGVRYEFSCRMVEVVFLEHEIITKRARKSYQLTLSEAKGVALIKASRATLPCPEEVMGSLRKYYWEAVCPTWDKWELMLIYLAIEWGSVTGRRPSNYTINSLKARTSVGGRDHNLLARDVTFVTRSGSRICSTEKVMLAGLVPGSVSGLMWSDTSKTTNTGNLDVGLRSLSIDVPGQRQMVEDMLFFAVGLGAGAHDDKGYFFSVDRSKAGKTPGAVLTFTKRSTSNMLATALKACGASVGVQGLTLKSLRVSYATVGESKFRHGGSSDRSLLDPFGNWASGSSTQVSTYSRVNLLLPEDIVAVAMTGTIRISHLAPLLGNRQRSAGLIPLLGKRSASSDDVEERGSKVGSSEAMASVASAVGVGGVQHHHASVEVVDAGCESDDYDFTQPDDVALHLEKYIYIGNAVGQLV